MVDTALQYACDYEIQNHNDFDNRIEIENIPNREKLATIKKNKSALAGVLVSGIDIFGV